MERRWDSNSRRLQKSASIFPWLQGLWKRSPQYRIDYRNRYSENSRFLWHCLHLVEAGISKEDSAAREELVLEEKQAGSGESDDSDLEDLSVRNKSYKPHRDVVEKMPETEAGSTRTTSCSSTRSSMDAKEIRSRVKKSVDKKQRVMRRRKRGEASAINRARRENRDTVKDASAAWKDDWWTAGKSTTRPAD